MAALAVALPAFLTGCATEPTRPPKPRIPNAEAPYLVEPTAGYPLTSPPDLESAVRAGWERLRQGDDPAAVEVAAGELGERDPGFHPAAVLAAQTAFLRDQDRRVVDLLTPIAAELPGYLACQLLLGRAAERIGELPQAWDAFAAVADLSPRAAERAAELRPRVVEIVAQRVRDSLERGRVEDAEGHLLWLLERAPDDFPTLESQRWLAESKGDPESELAVVRRLVERDPQGGYEERLGDLELEVGDVRRGLDILDDLARRHPENPDLAEKAARAKFLWRLQVQPEHVQELARGGRLDRADFATLLYWLVPEVRYAHVTNPPIATDILDHPRRDEIVRVLNLDLMTVDRTLHRFEPDEPVTRWQALAALLGLLERSDRDFSCLGGGRLADYGGSQTLVCRKAAQCGLVPEEADCLPGASVTGAEALDFFRRGLELLGS